MAFYLFRKMIRKLPGRVIRLIPIPEPALTEGFGSRGQIGGICREMGLENVLLVTDRNVYALGFAGKILSSLSENGIRASVFSDIDSEPTVEIIRRGRDAAAACGAQGIIALGGGSVLDSSKIIAAAAKHPKKKVERYLHKFSIVKGKTLPLITVPSTAGTGAENTVGAVVKNARGVKKATVVAGLNVTNVVLDSELTLTAPQSVTVWCGIDALSHGLEGLLSDTKSKPDDLEKSSECVRICMEVLPRLIENPGDVEARQKMCLAAHYGGNAINRQLAGYVHAIAHSIGAMYHIPHGKAIAFCLLPVVAAQKELCRNRLAALAVFCARAGKTQSADEAADQMIEALARLLRQCGLEKGCAALRPEDTPALIRMINADSINYSPSKTFRDAEIAALLDQIRKGDWL